MSKKTGHVPATFTDAGTGQTFEGGKDHLIDAGSYANYEAAGLVHEPAAKTARTPAKVKSTPRKSRSKAAAEPTETASAATSSASDAAPNA